LHAINLDGFRREQVVLALQLIERDPAADKVSSSRSACALASGVTSAPESIRAISSRRPASIEQRYAGAVTVPSLEALAIR
jgi:hypothetical protein